MTVNWYTEDVASAVAEAKTRQASLMVFVISDDEFTRMYENVLKSLDFSKKRYIAMKITAYTPAYEQLKEVYRIVPVPSILVIDWESGMVMERVAGAIFDEELQEALLDALTDVPKEEVPEPTKDVPKEKSKTPEPQEIVVEKPLQVKIQFKTPTGDTKTQVYQPNDKLEVLRKDVGLLFNLKTFELAVPYPRRTLSSDLDSQSLLDLSLSPASTILVLPSQEAAILPWNVVATFWRIVQCIIGYIQGWWQNWFPSNQNPSVDDKKND